jgi:hypothetical protein
MKNFMTIRHFQLIVTIIISIVYLAGGAIASETVSVAPSPVIMGAIFHFPWWGIVLVGVVAVLVILYFVFGNMERKSTSEFETTIIDDIVTAMKTEYSLSEKDLYDLAAGIIATRRCSDSRLAGLLRIEYEVEKVNASSVTRTTAVAIKKQNDFIVKKAKRTMTWDDLPGTIRKEFILKNENVLLYSLYSSNEKEG